MEAPRVTFDANFWNPGQPDHAPWRFCVDGSNRAQEGHSTLEGVMRAHPDANVTVEALETYWLRTDTLTAGRTTRGKI